MHLLNNVVQTVLIFGTSSFEEGYHCSRHRRLFDNGGLDAIPYARLPDVFNLKTQTNMTSP